MFVKNDVTVLCLGTWTSKIYTVCPPLFLVFVIRLVYKNNIYIEIMCKSDTLMFCMFLGKKALGVP